MSVTVTSGRDTIEVTRGETWITEGPNLHVVDSDNKTVATFRDWQYVGRKPIEWGSARPTDEEIAVAKASPDARHALAIRYMQAVQQVLLA